MVLSYRHQCVSFWETELNDFQTSIKLQFYIFCLFVCQPSLHWKSQMEIPVLICWKLLISDVYHSVLNLNVPTIQQILCCWDSQPDRTYPGIGKLIILSLWAEPQNVMMLERLVTQSSSQKCYSTMTWLHIVNKHEIVLTLQDWSCSLARKHPWATKVGKTFENIFKKNSLIYL